jgi:hypothetical protein
MNHLDSYNELLRAAISLDWALSATCEQACGKAAERIELTELADLCQDPNYDEALTTYRQFARIRLAIEHFGDVVGGH